AKLRKKLITILKSQSRGALLARSGAGGGSRERSANIQEKSWLKVAAWRSSTLSSAGRKQRRV
ncbi:hypothetical protein BIW11_07365, partial [Tropilaelaps mercedesae]